MLNSSSWSFLQDGSLTPVDQHMQANAVTFEMPVCDSRKFHCGSADCIFMVNAV